MTALDDLLVKLKAEEQAALDRAHEHELIAAEANRDADRVAARIQGMEEARAMLMELYESATFICPADDIPASNSRGTTRKRRRTRKHVLELVRPFAFTLLSEGEIAERTGCTLQQIELALATLKDGPV
jgi:hypothetical protein